MMVLKFHIKTFTGRYIPVEDRLRLDAVDEEGNKQSLFMTQRLTDKVIRVMVEHLEGQTPEGMPSDLVQEMQQDKAQQLHAEGGGSEALFMSSPSLSLAVRTAPHEDWPEPRRCFYGRHAN